MSDGKNTILGRRKFLHRAGASVIGLAAAGSAGFLFNNAASATANSSNNALPYKRLDPERAAERSYQNYFKGG